MSQGGSGAVTTAAAERAGSTAEAGWLTPDAKYGIGILIVDDESTICEGCALILRQEGFNVVTCTRADEARSLLGRRRFQIALLDLNMAQVTGLELLKACLSSNPEMRVIIMTGNPTVASSVEALEHGAWDYLPKPFSANQLQILVGRAAIAAYATHSETGAEVEAGAGEILGQSPSLRQVVELATRAARTDASVFLSGESGTGKEVVARFIHAQSRRSKKPFIAINCAAMPEALLESEMFGHIKGAFTGAVADKAGLLEAADGATLFLDELTEMSTATQAKLLRVVQDGVLRRVGSNGTDAVVDVRFIVATNRNPQTAIEEGQLRRDLYYRLRVVPLQLPPLRERREDIPLLASHFLSVYWAKHRRGEALPVLTAATVRALQSHAWPGNVRELQNTIERATVLLKPGSEVQPEDVLLEDEGSVAGPGDSLGGMPMLTSDESYRSARERLLAHFEKGYFAWLVTRSGGNMSKAARIAGVDRTTLYRLMDRHNLHRDLVLTER